MQPSPTLNCGEDVTDDAVVVTVSLCKHNVRSGRCDVVQASKNHVDLKDVVRVEECVAPLHVSATRLAKCHSCPCIDGTVSTVGGMGHGAWGMGHVDHTGGMQGGAERFMFTERYLYTDYLYALQSLESGTSPTQSPCLGRGRSILAGPRYYSKVSIQTCW